jgi:hypothetical protein
MNEFFWRYWSLISGPYACQAGALLRKPRLRLDQGCIVPDNEFILLIFTSLIGLSLLIPSLPLAHFFFFFLWYQGLHSGATPWTTPPALFVMGIFEIGSCELFAWAGFKPRSSWSLPPKWLELQAWATGARLPLAHCFVFLVELEFELRALYLQNSLPFEPHLQSILLRLTWRWAFEN